MPLPKLRSVIEREAAESSADEAQTTQMLASFLALVHVAFGCFVQLAVLFAGGGWKPSLCFELLGAAVATALFLYGMKLAARYKERELRYRLLLARRVPQIVWYAAVGISIGYALARKEWILSAWAALLLVTVRQFLTSERRLLKAQQRIAIAKADYERELQELMDRLTC